MIITCNSHGMNLIGASKFRNKPKKALDVYQTLLPFDILIFLGTIISKFNTIR